MFYSDVIIILIQNYIKFNNFITHILWYFVTRNGAFTNFKYIALNINYCAFADLPDIPKDLTVIERRRKRTLLLKWIPGKSPIGTVLYVVEERHHAGQHFAARRMGAWNPCVRTNQTNALLKGVIKPGRWYQFRVAAINENGSKGYSKNSLTFITSAGMFRIYWICIYK